MFTFARRASRGIHFFQPQGAGPVFILSHAQVKLLVLLTQAGGALARHTLRGRFCQRGGGMRYGLQSDFFAPLSRAAYRQSLKQLEDLGLAERYAKPIFYGWGQQPMARLTAPGRAVIGWLMAEWDGWPAYQRDFIASATP